MAKNGPGSKASKRGDAEADVQIIERANSTSAMFLGGAGSRGYSWMNAGSDPNWRPRSIPTTTPASNAREGPENQTQVQIQKRGNAAQEGTSVKIVGRYMRSRIYCTLIDLIFMAQMIRY